jgi:glycerol-3-phosphate acyltransferase PlsX
MPAGPSGLIAVDAMGADDGPHVVVEGAIEASRSGAGVTLVGPAELLRTLLQQFNATLPIVDAPEAVTMDESPLVALRKKPRASIKVACEFAASGQAAAVFSAGHTGATLFAAHAAFGMLPGVERPALAVIVPTRTGSAVLLDAGANVDCRASHLMQFGVMGAAYAEVALGCARPRVGLLSIGEEAGKGNDLTREAHALLSTAPVEFIGNLEARQLFSGDADVIVCDGFTGNIALKVGEGVVELLLAKLAAASSSRSEGSAGLSAEAASSFSAAKAGGAPLIGVNGLVVVGHGRSSARAIANGIALTARLAQGGVVPRVAEAVRRVLN